jgi:elongation factor Ts
MSVSIEQIKKLREETSASMSDVKKALEEANGDEAKAREILMERGKAIAGKKSDRDANEGLIFSYIHQGGKIGVLLELNCETDFVAKTEEFNALGKDIAMHIAAMNSKAVKKEDMPQDAEEGEEALLDQTFIKNPELKISDLITATIAKTGENIEVGKFVRYEI